MQDANQHRLASVLYVLALICSAASAQQTAQAQPALPPLPPPIYEPGELPPLPLPTEQQLQRGRELLDKIVYVIANVPLTDAAAVLKVFGFASLHAVTFPTYTWVGPKGKGGDFAQPNETAETGFSHVEVQPWVKDPNHTINARLSATLVSKELCISIDDARRVFGPIASRVNNSRIVDVHPTQRPTPLHGVGYLDFSPLHNPLQQEAGITFAFEYQTCVQRFSVAYFSKSKKGTE